MRNPRRVHQRHSRRHARASSSCRQTPWQRRMADRGHQSPDPKQALNDYRKRWGIECLFGDTKTRGLNLEDTHITNPEKFASLIVVVVVMLAITWAYRCATQTHGHKGHTAQKPR
ncbi:transposase [Mesorhizobium sp. M0410]